MHVAVSEQLCLLLPTSWHSLISETRHSTLIQWNTLTYRGYSPCQMKNTEQYFSVVLFTIHYSVQGGSKL